MRGFLLLAAAVLIATLGLGCRSDRSNQAYYYQGAPRTNLYPLTSPPPGTVQPVRGYGPTAVSATRDYYGQGNYAGVPAGYYSGQTQTAAYAPAGYYGGTTPVGYNSAGYTVGGYAASQNPFPAGTVSPAGNMITNPYGAAGGYCRVEDVTPNMNPNVPIKDPPVVIGNNITLGGAAGYTSPAGYVSQASLIPPSTGGYGSGAYAGSGSYGSYTTGTYPAPGLSAVNSVSTTGPGIVSGPVPYCGPGVSCPPDPRVDTSVYGTSTSVPAGTQVQTSYGDSVGTAELVGGGGSSGYGYTGTTPYTTGSYGGYSGGAYPSAIDTIPATHRDGEGNAPAFLGRRRANSNEPALPANAGGIRLVPAAGIPPGFHPNDAGPSQWFEIVRPGNGPLRIGRVSATCVCVGVRVPKRQFAAGERAFVEARTLSRPPVNNLTYGIYINVIEPRETVIDADVTIRF